MLCLFSYPRCLETPPKIVVNAPGLIVYSVVPLWLPLGLDSRSRIYSPSSERVYLGSVARRYSMLGSVSRAVTELSFPLALRWTLLGALN